MFLTQNLQFTKTGQNDALSGMIFFYSGEHKKNLGLGVQGRNVYYYKFYCLTCSIIKCTIQIYNKKWLILKISLLSISFFYSITSPCEAFWIK